MEMGLTPEGIKYIRRYLRQLLLLLYRFASEFLNTDLTPEELMAIKGKEMASLVKESVWHFVNRLRGKGQSLVERVIDVNTILLRKDIPEFGLPLYLRSLGSFYAEDPADARERFMQTGFRLVDLRVSGGYQWLFDAYDDLWRSRVTSIWVVVNIAGACGFSHIVVTESGARPSTSAEIEKASITNQDFFLCFKQDPYIESAFLNFYNLHVWGRVRVYDVTGFYTKGGAGVLELRDGSRLRTDHSVAELRALDPHLANLPEEA